MLLSESITPNADGTRASMSETQAQVGGSVTSSTTWAYDADGRLTGEAYTSDNQTLDPNYTDTYSYDLVGNRLSKTHAAGGVTTTTTNTFNADDQLVTSTVAVGSSTPTTTTFVYDANGSQVSAISTTGNGSPVGATVDTYNVRNQLVEVQTSPNSIANLATAATYVYDDAGNRVAETVGGPSTGSGQAPTTYYLIDAHNPTGYPKPIEQWTSTAGRADAVLSETYILGNSVIGQVNNSGTVTYLLSDFRGNTRALTGSTDGLVGPGVFNFDAFDNPTNGWNPAAIGTTFQTADAMYDGPSGLEFHGSGRESDTATGLFITADPQGYGDNSDPLSLHRYLYAGADPISLDDPSGHDLAETLAVTGILGSLGASLGVGINGINNYALGRPFFNGAASAAAFGTAGLPLSVAFPFVGIALAGLGLYSSGATAYQVFTNPNASAGQEGASAFLVGLSLFGAYSAASNASSSGSLWVNAKYFNSGGAGGGSITSYQAALENVTSYTEALQSALSGTPQQGRITLAVGVAEDASGNRFTLIGTSEPNGYIRPALRPIIYGWGGIVVNGTGHAEADIVSYANAQGWTLIGVGATRPICVPCAQQIAAAGATAATPLK